MQQDSNPSDMFGILCLSLVPSLHSCSLHNKSIIKSDISAIGREGRFCTRVAWLRLISMVTLALSASNEGVLEGRRGRESHRMHPCANIDTMVMRKNGWQTETTSFACLRMIWRCLDSCCYAPSRARESKGCEKDGDETSLKIISFLLFLEHFMKNYSFRHDSQWLQVSVISEARQTGRVGYCYEMKQGWDEMQTIRIGWLWLRGNLMSLLKWHGQKDEDEPNEGWHEDGRKEEIKFRLAASMFILRADDDRKL